MKPFDAAWALLKQLPINYGAKECPCGSGLRSLDVGHFYPNELRCKLCHQRKMEEWFEGNEAEIEQGADQQGYSMNDPNAFPQQFQEQME